MSLDMNSKFKITLLVFFSLACTMASNAEEIRLSTSEIQHNKPIRALHIVLKSVRLRRARWMVDLAHDAGFNTIIFRLSSGVLLDTSPWVAKDNAWSREKFQDWVSYIREKGMEAIPEIKLLTHQKRAFFQDSYPHLMFNADTYDPRKEEVYTNVFRLLNEVITLIDPVAIHIGHDEVAGHKEKSAKRWLREGESILPADLFLKDTLRVYDYLKKRNIETWMWGDMLISPSEFPGMHSRNIHGGTAGYGKILREKLPRDIVICDWHYPDKQPDFPSLAVMKTEGFRVLGTTWRKEITIKNFSRYAAIHNAEGMIATLWHDVQRRKWNVVEHTIKFSGETFNKDFPDAQ